MTALFKVASVLVCAATLEAQVTAVLNRPGARSPEIEIRNDSAANLVAFAVSLAKAQTVIEDGSPFLVFVDTIVTTDRINGPNQVGKAMPIPPKDKCIVPVPAVMRNGRRFDFFEPPFTIAAIFADGSTSGDTALLSRLMARRANMLQAVELARGILSDAGSQNVPPRQLVQRFRSLEESVSHWYLPPEQQVGRALYGSIIQKLINLPDQQFGSPFPPTTFVEQTTADLNRQRVALLESLPSK